MPDRLQEVQMLDRLEQSWLDQPYNRYYMQEDLRQTKMEYANYNLTVPPFTIRQGESFSRTASCSALSLFRLPTSPEGFTPTGPLVQEVFPSQRSNQSAIKIAILQQDQDC